MLFAPSVLTEVVSAPVPTLAAALPEHFHWRQPAVLRHIHIGARRGRRQVGAGVAARCHPQLAQPPC